MKSKILVTFVVILLSQEFVAAYVTPKASTGRGNPNVRFGYQNPIIAAPTLAPQRNPNFQTPFQQSTPKCPDGRDNNGKVVRFRLDRKTSQCFEIGSQNACGGKSSNMAFYEDPTNSQYGECDCLRNQNHPLVYHESTNTCYFIYQQAYCKDDQWLHFNDRQEPVCEVNPCRPFAAREGWDWKTNSNDVKLEHFTNGLAPDRQSNYCVALGATCKAKTGSDIPYEYPSSPTAIEDAKRNNIQVYTFRQGELEPKCQVPQDPRVPTDLQGLLIVRCRPGSKPRVLKQCTYF